MRFGVCCTAEQAPQALAAGFDYVELPAGHVFMERRVEAEKVVSLQAEATNLFLVGKLDLLRVDRDLHEYTEEITARAAHAGVEVMVLGSGPARRRPDDMAASMAEEAFANTCRQISQVGAANGVIIAPESLRREETNVGNELGKLAFLLKQHGVAYTADSYHVISDWRFKHGDSTVSEEFWESEIPFAPAHVHVAAYEGRSWQVNGDRDIAGFSSRLRTVGYKGRISIECQWKDWALELSSALAEVKAVFGAAEQT